MKSRVNLPSQEPARNDGAGTPFLEALQFARDTAQAEIAAVDRLHLRMLKSLGILLSGFVLVGSAVGWIGFQNLKSFVAAAAKQRTEDLVRETLGNDLTREHIQQAVKDVLTRETESRLDKIIREQTDKAVSKILRENEAVVLRSVREQTYESVKLLEPELRVSASREAQQLVADQLRPRILSGTQRQKSIEQLKRTASHQVSILAGPGEEYSFAAQIVSALTEAGWKADSAVEFDPSTSTGAQILVSDPAHPAPGAQALRDAFKTIGVICPILQFDSRDGGHAVFDNSGKAADIPVLVILPKPISETPAR